MDPLRVSLDGKVAGHIVVDGATSRFTFDDDYLADPSRFVLGLAFEEDLRRSWVGVNRLPAWFSNLLPEGQLRSLIGTELRLPESNTTNVSTEYTMLLALGADLPGAIEVAVVEDLDDIRRTRPVSEDIVPRRGGGHDGALRFSVAGVRIKFSMLQTDDQLVAPAAGANGDWLVKLPDRTFPLLPVNEYSMMSWAARSGVEVPEIRLVSRDEVVGLPDVSWSGESQAYAIKRFDRAPGAKIHIEDLAQVRLLYPEDKYLGNFETVANLIYRGSDESSLEEFIRRLTFAILSGNDDAHLKNWSLIYPDGRVPRIAPAYDFVSAAAYPGYGLSRDIGLKLAGSREYPRLTLASFEALGRKIEAPFDVRDVVVETMRSMRASFEPVREELAAYPELLVGIQEHFEGLSRRVFGI
jgi:serine/threonine-protein kinase HipA